MACLSEMWSSKWNAALGHSHAIRPLNYKDSSKVSKPSVWKIHFILHCNGLTAHTISNSTLSEQGNQEAQTPILTPS